MRMTTTYPFGALGHGLSRPVTHDGLLLDVIDDLFDAGAVGVGVEVAPAGQGFEF